MKSLTSELAMFTALTFLFLFYQQPELPPDAEKLPEVPKLSDKSVMKALNPEKTLFLETAPDKDGKMKPVRILFAAEVCLSKGPLEVFCTKRGTKEHESILRINFDAKYLHAGLLAIGAKPGKPVQWVDPKTEKPDYKPASGEFIDVSVNYTLKGKSFNHPAQEWILDSKTSKVMKHEWVFAGSRFYKNPERPADPDYYMANNGEVISISNFADSMLDLPVEVTSSNDDLFFQCNDKKIPPLLSKVWVIMTPKPKK